MQPDSDGKTIHHQPQNSVVPNLEQISVNKQEVLYTLNGSCKNKYTGADRIPVKLLKLNPIQISNPLSRLFNQSFQSGESPESWNVPNFEPVHKNMGSTADVGNYRPIRLLSCVSSVRQNYFQKVIDT